MPVRVEFVSSKYTPEGYPSWYKEIRPFEFAACHVDPDLQASVLEMVFGPPVEPIVPAAATEVEDEVEVEVEEAPAAVLAPVS